MGPDGLRLGIGTLGGFHNSVLLLTVSSGLDLSGRALSPAACRYTTASAYREVNVYVDGCLAAAFYPALVVYTGGICPLLWRPL
jgi:hypothetical protein